MAMQSRVMKDLGITWTYRAQKIFEGAVNTCLGTFSPHTMSFPYLMETMKRSWERKDEFGSWAHVDAADHEALFRAARASFEKETARRAASFREHVVVPVCEEHGLSFQSGMKGCSFRKGRMWIGGWEEEGTPEHRIAMKAGLRPIFEILNLDMQEAMGERVFGSLVESVGEGFGTGARVSRAAKRGKADTVKGAR